MKNIFQIPTRWVWVSHQEISKINPKNDTSKLDGDDLVTFLPMALVEEESGKFSLSEKRKLNDVSKGYTQFSNGDILFAKITPTMENGKVVIVENLVNGIGYGSTEFHVSRPHSLILKKYLFFYFVQPYFRNTAKKFMTGSAGQLRVPTDYFKNVEIPLPPFLEQKAIVAKIEQLFSELDNGIENLKMAQAKLKIYRITVLKKAFEGEFTCEWREKQSPLPTAGELLETIKQERENWINKEISNNNSEAKRLKSKLKKYTVNSFDKQLPLNWKWTSFLQATHMVVDCHNKTAPYTSSGIHLIRTSNVKSGKLNLEDKIKFVNEETYKYWSRRCPPEAGDILFTREAPMGEAAIIPENTKICMGQRMMLLRVFKHLLNEKYLLYAILDSTFQHRLGNSAIGTGVKHLRVGDVENLIFPICSVEEQNQIVQEVESRLSVCDKIEETIRNSLTKAEALRQSILKKAFEGNLLNAQEIEAIHTHPDYESAENLLKRIKQERAK